MFSLVSGSWGKDVAKEGNIWAAGEERVHEDVGEGMSNKRRGLGDNTRWDGRRSTVLSGGGTDLKT